MKLLAAIRIHQLQSFLVHSCMVSSIPIRYQKSINRQPEGAIPI